jgi:LysR family cyn operon transcriptional activator
MLHFTRAAESLYISQPSLSIHIQQLEEELKTKLFARVGRSVLLTEAGEILLVRARRAVAELETAGQEIDAMTGLLRGTLTIATIPLFGSKFLPSWIDSFSLLHPNMHISVRVSRAEDIENGLVSGAFDLGFSLLPTERQELTTKEMLADQIVMIVCKEHPLAKKGKLTVADLSTVPIAIPSHKISSVSSIASYFEKLGITPKIMVEQDDGHALLELVKLGGFATCLPSMAIRQDSDLCLLDLPPPGSPITIAAMWTQLSPAAKAFMELATGEDSYAKGGKKTKKK